MSRTVGSGNVRWTPLMDEYLLKKRLKGESFRAIGAGIGVSEKAARQRFVRRFPNVKQPTYIPHVRVHSFETRAAVIEMKQKGASHKQIARELNIRTWQVCGIWNHWRDYILPRATA